MKRQSRQFTKWNSLLIFPGLQYRIPMKTGVPRKRILRVGDSGTPSLYGTRALLGSIFLVL